MKRIIIQKFMLVIIPLSFLSCANQEIPPPPKQIEKTETIPVAKPSTVIETKKITIWRDGPKIPLIPFLIMGCEHEYGCTLGKNEISQEVRLFKTPDLEGETIQILSKGEKIVGVSHYLLIDTLPVCKTTGEKSQKIKFVHFGGEGAEYFWDGKALINVTDGHSVSYDIYSFSGKIYDCKKQKLPVRKVLVEVEYAPGKFGWTNQASAFDWFYP